MENIISKVLNYLSECEGYHQLCKGLHWQTERNAEHVIVDELDETMLKYQDQIAEVTMGLTGKKFTVGQLKTLLPNATTTEALLREILSDTIAFKKEIGDDIEVCALQNVLDDVLTDVSQLKYRAQLI